MTVNKFKVERTSGGRVEDSGLVGDLRRVARERGSDTVGMNDCRTSGAFSDTTVARRFGRWNEALKAAGLSLKNDGRASRRPHRSVECRRGNVDGKSPYALFCMQPRKGRDD
jgi:hypothetical protein